ncbi:hypothetical protein [Microbacterium hominis]|uniref:hypothetical protein n=1 Tax=Microbacterium hominis TaxID=162426 RepID=UPI00077CBFA2|nr:hypothetical protein [Microbacterium hominis]
MTFDASPLAPPPMLRTLRADESPFPGVLRAGDPPTVWVPADELPDAVWRARGDEHVLAPVDVARSADGHVALLPHCAQRLTTVIAAGAPLSPGAVVTAAISMLRGAAEALRCGISTGSWWVDADGRPVLAAGGSAPWRQETVRMLELLSDDSRGSRGSRGALGAALAEAIELVSADEITPRRHERVEQALFSAAEPSSLIGDERQEDATSRPRRAATVWTADDIPVTGTARLSGGAGRLFDHHLVERAHEAIRATASSISRLREIRGRAQVTPRRHARGGEPAVPSAAASPARRSHRHRAPALVAAAIALVVVGVGVAWPVDDAPSAAIGTASTGAHGSASEGASTPSPTATAPRAAPTAAPTAGAGADAADERAQVDGLLSELAACVAGGVCDGVLEDPTASMPVGVATDAAAARRIDVLDEYGGVAVYRVSADGRAPQVVVLVSTDGKWLVRDVYDVADQP